MVTLFFRKDDEVSQAEEESIAPPVPREIRTKKKKKKASPSKLIEQYRDEENALPVSALKDEDQSHGNTSEASSLPPPPPPEPTAAAPTVEQKGSAWLFRTRSFQSKPEHARHAYVFEEDNESIEMQDVSHWPASWNKSGSSGKQKLLLASIICLLIAGLALGLVFGLSKDSNEAEVLGQSSNQNQASSLQPAAAPIMPPAPSGDIPGPTIPAPGHPPAVPAPTPSPTKAPTPTLSPTRSPSRAPEEQPCVDNIDTSKTCYDDDDTIIWVGFTNCEAFHDDWIGIYSVDNILDNGNLGPGHSLWLWTCGSQDLEDCRNQGVFTDTVPFFSNDLPDGTYRAYLVRNNENDEYVPHALSEEFQITSDSCS